MPRGHGKRSSAIHLLEWEPHREEICELYETKPLEKVQALMRKRHGFAPTLSQYKRQLGLWGATKNRRTPTKDEKIPSPKSMEMSETHEVWMDTWMRFALFNLVGFPLHLDEMSI